MQAIMETIFDVVYLFTVIFLGIKIIKSSKGNKQSLLFGIMAIILGCGDSFHLVPRMIALNTTGLENYTSALGFGKFVTSITMTIFYLLLYIFLENRYDLKDKKTFRVSIYFLAIVRVALCVFPQNKWTSADSPVSWGIYRNIPFLIMGLIIIYLFFKYAKEKNDITFKFMWLAITLSFAFYIPVVLWADKFPLVGMLMIPKTCAYVWIVWMGYKDFVINNK